MKEVELNGTQLSGLVLTLGLIFGMLYVVNKNMPSGTTIPSGNIGVRG